MTEVLAPIFLAAATAGSAGSLTLTCDLAVEGGRFPPIHSSYRLDGPTGLWSLPSERARTWRPDEDRRCGGSCAARMTWRREALMIRMENAPLPKPDGGDLVLTNMVDLKTGAYVGQAYEVRGLGGVPQFSVTRVTGRCQAAPQTPGR